MHLNGFGIAYGFTAQPFYSGSEGQILAFYPLGVLLAYYMFKSLKIAPISAPIIRVEAGYAKGFKKRFELPKNDIFTLSKNKCQNSSGFMVYGEP